MGEGVAEIASYQFINGECWYRTEERPGWLLYAGQGGDDDNADGEGGGQRDGPRWVAGGWVLPLQSQLMYAAPSHVVCEHCG
jgi:hypothetical protein